MRLSGYSVGPRPIDAWALDHTRVDMAYVGLWLHHNNDVVYVGLWLLPTQKKMYHNHMRIGREPDVMQVSRPTSRVFTLGLQPGSKTSSFKSVINYSNE